MADAGAVAARLAASSPNAEDGATGIAVAVDAVACAAGGLTDGGTPFAKAMEPLATNSASETGAFPRFPVLPSKGGVAMAAGGGALTGAGLAAGCAGAG